MGNRMSDDDYASMEQPLVNVTGLAAVGGIRNLERDWAQFHSQKNLVMAFLTGEVGESAEVFQ
jgi:hypothetical protein